MQPVNWAIIADGSLVILDGNALINGFKCAKALYFKVY